LSKGVQRQKKKKTVNTNGAKNYGGQKNDKKKGVTGAMEWEEPAPQNGRTMIDVGKVKEWKNEKYWGEDRRL